VAQPQSLTNSMNRSLPRLNRTDLAAAGLLVLAAAYMSYAVVHAPRTIGTYQDDGIYLVTAKSLAEGKGYRHLELPGEPYQTKYPILYPLLVSLIWRVWPQFPDNIAGIQVANVLLWSVGSWLAYRLMRQVWQLPGWLAAAGPLLALANPTTAGLFQTAMAECLYLPLSMAALLLAHSTVSTGPAGQSGRWLPGRAILFGLMAGGAYLTRLIGITVAAAAVVSLMLARRWKAAAASAICVLLVASGWQLWCGYATAANRTNPAIEAFRYDLDYSAWRPRDPASLVRIVPHNAAAMALALLTQLTPIPNNWLTRAPGGGLAGGWRLYSLMLISLVLVGVGLAGTWQRAWPILHLYLVIYIGLVLLWPFRPWRFLLPILPLLTGAGLAGAYLVVVLLVEAIAGRDSSISPRPQSEATGPPSLWQSSGTGHAAAIRIVFVVAGMLAFQNLRPIVTERGRQYLEQSELQREALIDLLRSQTPPDAVICSLDNAYLHLRTGRKIVPFVPYEYPVPSLYPPDLPLSECGHLATPGRLLADLEHMRTRLPGYLQTARVGYLVADAETDSGIVFGEFLRARPDLFRAVRTAGRYSLYRVTSR